jgi:hypothetical protein
VLGDQLKEITAHDQRQQCRIQQNLDDVLFSRVELVKFVLRLQLPGICLAERPR